MIIKDIVNKISIKMIVYFIIAILLVGVFLFINHKKSENKIKSIEMLVSARLEECAELCILKYEYEGKVELQTTALFGLSTSEYESKYRAVVRAGIPDMRDIRFEIKDKGKTIIIKLPPLKILGNDTVDEGRVITDNEGLIARKIMVQDVLAAIKDSKAKRLEELTGTDFLSRAEDRVKSVLSEQFTGMGFQKVVFR